VKVGMIWAADAFGMSDNGAQRTDGVQISVANDPSETFGVQCGNGFAIQSMVIRTVARPAISMQD
jgi:hypothetical protein